MKCMAAGVLLTSLLRADASADLKAAVDKSMKAMGAENVKTLVISGEGWDGCVGQPYNPNTAWWRKFSNKNYVRSIDFDAEAGGCKESAAKVRIRRAAAVGRALLPTRIRIR